MPIAATTATPFATARHDNITGKAAGLTGEDLMAVAAFFTYDRRLKKSERPPMAGWIKSPKNQLGRTANDKFIAYWRGQAVSRAGVIRHFDTEQEAREYLARCDAAERIVD